MKLIFDYKFRFYTSKMNEICLHCRWLYFSSIIMSFRQGVDIVGIKPYTALCTNHAIERENLLKQIGHFRIHPLMLPSMSQRVELSEEYSS